MTGNKEIAVIGEKTRFGAENGPDPAEAAKKAKPWSVRNSVRRLAAAKIVTKNGPSIQEQIESVFGEPGVMTVAQLVAVKKVGMALKGNLAAIESITDDVDGKLVQKEVKATVSLADLVNKSYEIEDGRPAPSSE